MFITEINIPAGHNLETLTLLLKLIEREIGKITRSLQNYGIDPRTLVTHSDRAAYAAANAEYASIHKQLLNRLDEYKSALHRIETSPNGFGICHSCKSPIPAARLELLPTTLTCSAC